MGKTMGMPRLVAVRIGQSNRGWRRCALTADPDDPADIARAIGSLLCDPDARAKAVDRGLLQASRFNWRAAAVVLVAAYRDHFSGLGGVSHQG